MTRFLWLASICAAFGSIALLSPGGVSAQPAGAKAQKVPEALVDFGEFGENVYDLAKAGDWTKVAEKFKALQGAAKALPDDLKGGAAAKKKRDETLAALGQAIAAKDKLATMRGANQVTRLGAALSAPFDPQVPATITLLDFYGRELEIGTAAKDQKQLKAAAAGLRQNWDKVRPAVVARGGNAEAKRFDALVTRVEAAPSVEAYGALVTPILDEVDNLEKVFKK